MERNLADRIREIAGNSGKSLVGTLKPFIQYKSYRKKIFENGSISDILERVPNVDGMVCIDLSGGTFKRLIRRGQTKYDDRTIGAIARCIDGYEYTLHFSDFIDEKMAYGYAEPNPEYRGLRKSW